MKSKLLILLLLISSYCFGQTSVPNTDTFSLNDVYTAVHAHTSGTSTNLQSCFDNAISGYFDPTYNQDSYSPIGGLLRFRNYHPSCLLFTDINFFAGLTSPANGINTFTDFTGNLTSAQNACTIANQSFQSGNVAGFNCYRFESLTVGKQAYNCDIGVCNTNNVTGYFIYGAVWGIYNVPQGSTKIVYILNGIIQSITSCS